MIFQLSMQASLQSQASGAETGAGAELQGGVYSLQPCVITLFTTETAHKRPDSADPRAPRPVRRTISVAGTA